MLCIAACFDKLQGNYTLNGTAYQKKSLTKLNFNDLVSCTSLGGINIRMLFLGFVIEIIRITTTKNANYPL
jgi:hypothetical protein